MSAQQPMTEASRHQMICLLAAIMLLLVAAAFGGSSLRTAPGWPYVFSAGAIGCALALTTLKWKHVVAYRGVLLLGVAAVALPGLQLIPLPPDVWQSLPGRDLTIQVDQAAKLGNPWRPLSLVPPLTLHAFMGMLLPLALILHTIQLDYRHQRHLLSAVVCLILLSGLFGILQAQSPTLTVLLGYKIDNDFVASGFFSNRNHQALALVCGLPFAMAILAEWQFGLAKLHKRLPALTAIAIAILFFTMVLVTGSRAGLILFGVAICVLPLLWPSDQSGRKRSTRARSGIAVLLLAVLLVVCLLAFDNGRAISLSRLIESDAADEMRPVIYKQTLSFVGAYWPVGTGAGTFLPIYSIHEPSSLLLQRFVNQAHNDWLDLVLTSGLAGIVLVVAYAVHGLIRAWDLFARRGRSDPSTVWGRAAFVVLVLSAAASLTDYPLRTPLMMSLVGLAVVWLTPADKPHQHRSRSKGR